MAPAPAVLPATRSAPGTAPVRAGARARVMPARASVRTGPTEARRQNDEPYSECHLFNISSQTSFKKKINKKSLTWIWI